MLTGLVAARGGTTATFTVAFGAGAAPIPDRPYAEDVVRLWKTDHEEVTIQSSDLLSPAAISAVLAAKDYPTPFGDKNISPFLFSRRIATKKVAALSGEGADSVFGGVGGAINEQRILTTFPWVETAREFGRYHGIGTGLFAPELLRAIDTVGYMERMFREACDEVSHVAGAAPADRLGRQVDHLVVTRLLDQALQHSERLSAAAGLQVRFPFADHRLYSYLYNVPAHLKYFDGREKSLLRVIGEGIVPDSVMARRKVTYPVMYEKSYKGSLLTRLRSVLDDAASPVLPLIDVAASERIIATPKLFDRGGWFGRGDIEMVLQLNSWMQWLNVHTDL